MSVLELARPELLERHGYQAALGRFDVIRLHANEMAYWDDSQAHGLNRYPPARPAQLMERLAEALDIEAHNLLLTRGSNEGIDLLVRAFCTAGRDRIVTCSPTFGMYRICAEVQNAGHLDIPLDTNFDIDIEALTAIDASCKLVFLCSPGNPSGKSLSQARVAELCRALAQRAVVVLDEAYLEFATDRSVAALLETFPNLVILRTFSKAYGLAGLRAGLVIGQREVIALLDSLLPPYAIPTPTIDGMLAALEPRALGIMETRIAHVMQEKQALVDFLRNCPGVIKVFPSDANFVLVKFTDADHVYTQLVDRGILVRKFDTVNRLAGCLRITIGNQKENAMVREALAELLP